jgi:hypothetical protein
VDTLDKEPDASRLLPTVLVAKRGKAVHDDSLQMKSDNQEIPDPLKAAASYLQKEKLTLKDVVGAKSNQSRWFAIGSFEGQARTAGNADLQSVDDVQGPVAMTVVETEGRLLGILAPQDLATPAVWFAWPLAELSVETAGEQGTFRKRPRRVTIRSGESSLELVEIAYVRNDKSSFTQKREAAFVEAVGAA